MTVDFDAYVGDYWPGREADGRPAQVRARLTRTGFGAAFVALLEGPWYRDYQAANRRLSELVAEDRDFFLPLGCVDPTAIYWMEDLDTCTGELGMTGVKLYPGYHHYSLDEQCVTDLCDYAGESGFPVFISMMAEEDRFAHPAVKSAIPATDALFALLAKASNTTFVVNMLGAGGLSRRLSDLEDGERRIFFDTTRMDKDTLSLDELVAESGSEWFVVGSHAPFFYPEGAIFNLGFRTITREAIGEILKENQQTNAVLREAIAKLEGTTGRLPTSTPIDHLAEEDWPALVGKSYGKIIDNHAHFTVDNAYMKGMIEQAERAGVGRILLNGLGMVDHETFGGWQMNPDADQVDQMNTIALDLCKEYPDLLTFVAYINPRLGATAVEQVERWVTEHRAVGLKIHRCRENGSIEKALPIVEKAAELDVPILFHTFFRKGGNDPAELSPLDLVEFAKAYPAAKLIAGHFGGDWIRAVRSIKPYPNIYGDTSGCTHRDGFTEYVVREIGAERVLFGVDMWCRAFGTQIAKVTAADISEAEKDLILFANQKRIFSLGGAG